MPDRYNPEAYLKFAVPGTGLLIAILFITLVGFLGRNLIGRSIVSYSENILNRMPLVRTVYKSTKQIFETVLKEQGNSFKKVGLIEFPRAGTSGRWSSSPRMPRARLPPSSIRTVRRWSPSSWRPHRSRRLAS